MTGEVTLVYDDGTVTARLHGIATQITIGAEQLALVAKKKTEPGRKQPLRDVPD